MTSEKGGFAIIPTPSLRFIFEAFVLLLFSLLLMLFEPAFLDDPVDEMSFGFFNRVSQSLYPDSEGDPVGEKLRNVSSVVLISQASLEQTEEDWPPSFGFHAAVLERILAAKPAAIVIDFLFVDKREDESLEALIEAFQIAKQEEVPLIVTRPFGDEFGLKGILKELNLDNVELVSGWSKEEHVGSPFRYALYLTMSGGRPIRSPAAAAYTAYCDRLTRHAEDAEREAEKITENSVLAIPIKKKAQATADKARQGANECDDLKIDISYNRDMWVYWSARKLDYVKTFYGVDPNAKADDFEPETFKAVSCKDKTSDSGLVDTLLDAAYGEKNECPPQLILPAHFLVADDDPRIDIGLTDRIVFYGFNLQGLQDFVSPPTTANPVPGVFKHAMAFENLLLWKNDYLAMEMSGSNWSYMNADIFEFLTLFTILLAYFGLLRLTVRYVKRTISIEQGPIDTLERISTSNLWVFCRNLIRFLGYSIQRMGGLGFLKLCLKILLFLLVEVALLLIVLFLAIYAEMDFLRIAPVNWMVILGFSTISIVISLRILLRDVV